MNGGGRGEIEYAQNSIALLKYFSRIEALKRTQILLFTSMMDRPDPAYLGFYVF